MLQNFQPLTLYRGKNAAPTFIRWAFGVERWACPNCRSDIFVTIRAARPAYTMLQNFQPLTFYRGKNAAPTFIRWAFWVERWACPNCRRDIFVTIRVVKPAFTALMFIGPPLADIAAKMPLLVSLHEHLISYLMFTESGEAESLLCTLMQ